MFYLTLRDLVLYCFKDEKSTSYESPAAAIRIHHSLASVAADYTKKQFVFRLRTSDRAEYLFQTSDQKELETWVDTINTVVSRYSAPPLAAPCGNNNKVSHSQPTRLGLNELLSVPASSLPQLEEQQHLGRPAGQPQGQAQAAQWGAERALRQSPSQGS